MTGEMSSRDDERDYAEMEAALSESARGRWFLSEHARRRRGGDTQLLLDTIGRIEALGPNAAAAPEAGRLDADLADLARLIADARDDIAPRPPGDPAGAAVDLSRRIDATTSDVLDATERIQEAAWNLRERGADPAICDLLDQRATEIYAACAVQDGLTRRTAAVIRLVRVLEDRLGALRSRGAPGDAQAGPAESRAGAEQDPSSPPPVEPDPFAAIASSAPASPAEAGADASRVGAGGPGWPAIAERAGPPDDHPTTLAAIDVLDAREKLRLFT